MHHNFGNPTYMNQQKHGQRNRRRIEKSYKEKFFMWKTARNCTMDKIHLRQSYLWKYVHGPGRKSDGSWKDIMEETAMEAVIVESMK
jgi:DUF971 family protein